MLAHAWNSSCSGARFSKVPKLFGRLSGDIIPFVSSKRRRLEARNFAIIFTFTPFTTYEKISFTEQAGRSFKSGFSGPKSSRGRRVLYLSVGREVGALCVERLAVFIPSIPTLCFPLCISVIGACLI